MVNLSICLLNSKKTFHCYFFEHYVITNKSSINYSRYSIIYNQYVDVMMLLILIGKLQNVTAYLTTERVNVKVIKD